MSARQIKTGWHIKEYIFYHLVHRDFLLNVIKRENAGMSTVTCAACLYKQLSKINHHVNLLNIMRVNESNRKYPMLKNECKKNEIFFIV